MSKSFIVIIRRAWCNEGGHGIEYSSDLIHYETRNGAISHGFRAVDSDDFNIGVIEGGKLISFDWMDKPVGESEDMLAQIAELIGLEDAA
ncbi:TPA: antitoxin [Klebsiella pneumoniae]|nr:antitoxin [Klebsiella pneumoniae]